MCVLMVRPSSVCANGEVKQCVCVCVLMVRPSSVWANGEAKQCVCVCKW